MKTPGTDGLADSINYSFLKMYFWLHWVFTDAHGLSLVVVSRGYSNSGAWASHCGGFYSPRAQVLEPWSWVVVVHRLSCPMACGIFLEQGSSPCPLHWQGDSKPLDTREVLSYFLNYSQCYFLHSAVMNCYQRSLFILSLNLIKDHSLVIQWMMRQQL